ncbi:MAG: hypothetical protein QW478_11280 [Candidatus Micrarchaeaceae archaeon]
MTKSDFNQYVINLNYTNFYRYAISKGCHIDERGRIVFLMENRSIRFTPIILRKTEHGTNHTYVWNTQYLDIVFNEVLKEITKNE